MIYLRLHRFIHMQHQQLLIAKQVQQYQIIIAGWEKKKNCSMSSTGTEDTLKENIRDKLRSKGKDSLEKVIIKALLHKVQKVEDR